MVYTKEEFKELWEANKYGSGITHDDIADCAEAWGISSHPRKRPIDEITYKVLKAAQVNDAEEYNPGLTTIYDKAQEYVKSMNDAAGGTLDKHTRESLFVGCRDGMKAILNELAENIRQANFANVRQVLEWIELVGDLHTDQ